MREEDKFLKAFIPTSPLTSWLYEGYYRDWCSERFVYFDVYTVKSSWWKRWVVISVNLEGMSLKAIAKAMKELNAKLNYDPKYERYLRA